MSRARIASAATILALATAGLGGSAAADDHARGEALYALCAQCHGAQAEGNKLAEAPALAGLPQWYIESQVKKFQNGQRGNHPDDVQGLRMGPMSRWLRSDEDTAAVAAFIADLPDEKPVSLLEGGDAEAGKQAYTTVCIACHGADGMGNQQMGSPPLKFASDWYLYRSLENFKAGLRGTNPNDPIAATMRPMAMTLVDDQAMLNVIAYILSLPE